MVEIHYLDRNSESTRRNRFEGRLKLDPDIAAKCAPSQHRVSLNQTGATVHATGHFADSVTSGQTIVKLDISNTFKSIDRESMLESIAQQLTEI